MSNNKYIIDKDSLTGIADAVRDKLGTGEAITDEDAGYYPASAITGVYAPSITLSLSTGSTGTSSYGLKLDESPYESLYGNNPFFFFFFFGSYSDPGLSRSQVRMDINSTACTMTYNSTNGKIFSAICSFESPQNSFLMGGSTNGYISPSYSSTRTFTFSAMHFILKDANDNVILPKLENLPVTWNPYGSTATRTVVTGDMYYQDVATPIPFSIDDIQNKITNYLIKGDSVKSAMFFLNDSANDNEHTSSVYYSGGWFINLNGSYASNALLKLRPENIQYILSYSPGSTSGTNFYQYDPKIKALQHYTSFSLSESGYPPRISGVTDYYFLANATKHYTSWTFGLACFDNGTDLDFQIVQKSSGSTLEGQLKASRFTMFQPTMFFIIYKEATE